MQDTDTVHYIVAVKRKADEMDVKDKEMTIELENVSEEENRKSRRRSVLIKNSSISERAAVLKR